jgi:hypothetical protein
MSKIAGVNKGGSMKKKLVVQVQLGDLIYQLFEEAKQVSSEPTEQKLLVYAALRDLLRTHRVKQATQAA